MIIVGTFTEILLRINTDKIRLSFFVLNDVYSVWQGDALKLLISRVFFLHVSFKCLFGELGKFVE